MDQSQEPAGGGRCWSDRGWTPVVLLFALAVIVRAGGAYLAGMWQDPVKQMGMPAEEIVFAQNLAAGRGYVTPYGEPGGVSYPRNASAHSPPGYPVLLAGMIRVGHALRAPERWPYRCAVVLSLLAGALVPAVLAAVARSAAGHRGFWATGLLAAGWPLLVRNSYLLWDTPFLLLGISLSMYLAVIPPRVVGAGAGLFWGGLGGLLTLFNPLVVPVFGAGLLLRLRQLSPLRRAAGYGLAVAAVWGALLVPWTVRNAAVFGRFIPIRNNLGLELWLGNRSGADGTTYATTRFHPSDEPVERRLVSTLGDDGYMRRKQAEAMAWIRAQPGSFARLTVRRVLFFWFGNFFAPDPLGAIPVPGLGRIGIARLGSGLALLALAGVGLWTWRSGPGRLVFWIGVLLLPLPYYVTHISTNYRAIVLPLLLVPAGLALSRAWRRLAPRGTGAA